MKTNIRQNSIQIGISVYQQELKHLEECINSCLNQNDIDLEIVVRIDGPDAANAELCNLLDTFEQDNANIKVIHGRHRIGNFYSLRNIFKKSSCEFICQVDADDCLAIGSLPICMKEIKRYPKASFIYTDCIDIDTNGSPIRLGERQKRKFSYQGLLVQFITFHLRLIRRKCYLKVGGYSKDLKYTGDYDLSLKLSEVGEVVYLPRPLYYYRVHGKSYSQQNNYEVNEETFSVCMNALRRRGMEDDFSLIQQKNGSLTLFRKDNKDIENVGEEKTCNTKFTNEEIFYISPVETN